MTDTANDKGKQEAEKPQKAESPFEAFPEPRGWPGMWVGSALYEQSKPAKNPNVPKRS